MLSCIPQSCFLFGGGRAAWHGPRTRMASNAAVPCSTELGAQAIAEDLEDGDGFLQCPP